MTFLSVSIITFITDSLIKKIVDNWYKENIYDKNLESYIVNQVFCNDRSLYSGDGYSWTKATMYSPYHRVLKQPSLMCQNQNDKFTLKVDSLSSIKGTSNYGNNALNYPVGIITVDEVILSGGFYGRMNSKYFVNTGGDYGMWTASSMNYAPAAGDSNVFAVRPGGIVESAYVVLSFGVRPVINLKSDINVISGSGTVNDPYILRDMDK